MPSRSAAIKTLSAFVSGELPAPTFEQRLYGDSEIEFLTSQERAPSYCNTGTTLFHYLIGLDYGHPRDVLDAHGALRGFLANLGVVVTPASAPGNEHELLLAAQPRWIDADLKFLADVLAGAPPLSLPERKAWLRQRILELFRYVKRPPRWIQSPAWPMGKAGPMVFLGQMPVDGYFHDTAAAYIFHDPATGECTSIIQVA